MRDLDRVRGVRLHPAVAALTRGLSRLLPAIAFLVAGAAVLLRQTGVPKALTIWAEDGTIFMACAYSRPLVPDCLLEPYAGYAHVIPRIGAAAAALWPPVDVSIVLAATAAVVTGWTAAVVAVAVRDASGSWLAGLVAGCSLALVWQAGIEVGGNLTNLHWILLTGSSVLIVAWWVGARPGPGSLALLAGTALSSPFAPILVVLGFMGVVLRRPGWRPLLAVVGLTALVQVTIILTTPREAPGSSPFDPGVVIGRFISDVLGLGAFGPARLPFNWLVPLAIAATVAIAALVAVVARRSAGDREPDERLSAARTILVVAALVGIGTALFVATVFLQHTVRARYGYLPSALMCIALVFGSALLGRLQPVGDDPARGLLRWAVRLMLPAAALLLVLGFARTFRLETRASAGPDIPAAFRAASPTCGAGAESIRLRISPIDAVDVWTIDIPCSRVVAPSR